MTPEQFFAEALPWAQQAHPKTNVLVSVILAQWADETGFGGPDWSPNNNPGNVGSYDNQPVATFPTLQDGVNAYVQTMNLPYYTAVRNASTWQTQATALGESPWASGHYGNPPGADLIAIINEYDLFNYDVAKPQGGEVLVAMTSTGNGYWVVKPDGSVYAYGDAQYRNGINNSGPNGTSALPAGDAPSAISGKGTDGYLISTVKGQLYAFGSAKFLGKP